VIIQISSLASSRYTFYEEAVKQCFYIRNMPTNSANLSLIACTFLQAIHNLFAFKLTSDNMD